MTTEEELVGNNTDIGDHTADSIGHGSSANFMPLEGEETAFQEDLGSESSHFQRQDGIYGRQRETFEGDSPMLRACLVILTYTIAISIPNVQELISLSGAFAGSSCALIIPPLVELRSILENHHRLSLVAINRYILLVIGAVFLVVGTVASIIDIVEAFGS